MDAWLHTECGLDNMTRAQYTPQELHRLQLGYFVRERGATRTTQGAAAQRRSIRQGQQQARREMLDDLGFE